MSRWSWIVRRDLTDEEWDEYLEYWWVPRLKAWVVGLWAGITVTLFVEWLRSR